MQSMENKMRAMIEQIAREHLGIETLERRWSDSLDFTEQAVWNLREALMAAWQAGYQAAKLP